MTQAQVPKRHKRWLMVAALLGLGGVALVQLGWLDRALRGDQFWEALEQAKPLVKARADAALSQLGYNPAVLQAKTYPTAGPDFGGDETWVVYYWQTPLANADQKTAGTEDFQVYLNEEGTVRRVTKREGDQFSLLFGKDRRIEREMTYEQVRQRLGEPDGHGPTPQRLRKRGDELWVYKADVSLRMTIEVYFEDGQVSALTSTGAGHFPLNETLLHGTAPHIARDKEK